MAKIRTIQIYRGTKAQNDAYTGSVGELTMDTDNNDVRIHDGSTLGGHPIGYHPDLLDWKWADHQLNDVQWLRADTFSWQDGSVYEAAYQHLVEDYNEAHSSEDWTAATQDTNLGSNDWYGLAYDGTKFVALGYYGHISTSTDGTTWTAATQNANLGSHSWSELAWDGTKFVALGHNGWISTSTDGTTWATATQNTNLGLKDWRIIVWDGTKFVALGGAGYISTSTDGTTWTTATQNANLGSNGWRSIVWDGTKFVALGGAGYISVLDVAQTETIAGITIIYYAAADGHKIVLADQESNVASIYTATGVAWYYVIDTANQRFKLPRRHSQQIVRSVKNVDGSWYRLYADGWVEQGGQGIASSNTTTVLLPIEMADTKYTATGGIIYSGTSTGTVGFQFVKNTTSIVIGARWNGAFNNGLAVDWQVSGQSAIDMSSFQGSEKHLYFYVGAFTQTAIENTAGLNAELFNGKADLNLANVLANIDFVIERQEPTAENNYIWYRKYRSGWVEQGGVSDGRVGTVVLPVEMADMNYTLLCSGVYASRTNTGGAYWSGVSGDRTSTTTITLGQAAGFTTMAWEVKGIAAS